MAHASPAPFVVMEVFAQTLTYILLFFTLYFEVFLVVTFFEGLSAPKFSGTTVHRRHWPSVTIIVPAWNEEQTLDRTVRSLLALNYPKDRLRIVIVDDGSTDGTLHVARNFEKIPSVSVLTKENGGKHTALNLGIAHVTSDLVGCLDADSFVDPGALQAIVPYFDDPTIAAVTPSVQIWKPDNPLRRMQAIEYMIGAFTRKIFSLMNGLYVTPGPFSIYRTSVFDKIGGFVHGFGTEDMEMAMRMQFHRMRIANAENAYVYTVSPKTLRALLRQRVRWVTGFLKNVFFAYRPMLFSLRHGNLGMLTLPFAALSIFIALFFSIIYLDTIIERIWLFILKYSALGLRFDPGWPDLAWWKFNVEFHRLVIYLLLIITVFFIIMGVRWAGRRVIPVRDVFYFFLLYGLIAPLWLARSVFNLITAREAPWR